MKQPYFNPKGQIYICLFFFAHSILDRLLFMDMVVFEIAIPIVILRNTEVIKLSANDRWGLNKNNQCWNLLLHIFQLTWQCYGS